MIIRPFAQTSFSKMASSSSANGMNNVTKKQRGGQYCVAGGPNQNGCKNGQFKEGISVHQFPNKAKDGKRHRLWVRFVQRYRPNWQPSSSSVMCSFHFEESCFTTNKAIAEMLKMRRKLQPDAIPTINVPASEDGNNTKSNSRRKLRKILREHEEHSIESSNCPSDQVEEDRREEDEFNYVNDDECEISTSETAVECNQCCELKQRIIKLQKKLSWWKRTKKQLRDQISAKNPEENVELMDTSMETEFDIGENDDDELEEEMDVDDDWEPSDSESEDDDDSFNCKRNFVKVDRETSPVDEPKFLVFYSMLMNLFSMFCFNCKVEKPAVEMIENGSMVTIIQRCKHCEPKDHFHWRSQPYIMGKHPAGNMLMSFGILLSGCCINKALLMFRHIGLQAISRRTYCKHQQKFLFPSIIKYWKMYQSKMIDLLKDVSENKWSGDGRFDSMGHSAKYGTYTMFSSAISKLVCFKVFQSNQSGSSNAMELDGVKDCFEQIKQMGLTVSVFISDRHRGIAKWIREDTDTKHFVDIWHVSKGLSKKILKASKEKGCGILQDWMKGIRNHLYWCALSTNPGFGKLMVAKWKSLMRHVANKHHGHEDPLFPDCAHDHLEERRWIKIGTKAYDKLAKIILDKQLLRDIEMLSADAQTSCLEGYHSTLNHWHPKMTHFSWLGTFCRTIIASLHYNENLNREAQLTKDGKTYYQVTFPKFKSGDEVVRVTPVPATYNYAHDIKKVILLTNANELKNTLQEYKENAPEPLCRQFHERKSREEAIAQQREKRSNILLFPSEPIQKEQQAECDARVPDMPDQQQAVKVRCCKKCNLPCKGHPRGRCPVDT